MIDKYENGPEFTFRTIIDSSFTEYSVKNNILANDYAFTITSIKLIGF